MQVEFRAIQQQPGSAAGSPGLYLLALDIRTGHVRCEEVAGRSHAFIGMLDAGFSVSISIISLVSLEGVMHPSGCWMRDFHASIISLVLLEGVMHPSGCWMLDFYASIISLVLLEGVMHPSGYWMLEFHASIIS